MKSMAEHNLGVKVEALKLQLETKDSIIGTYQTLALSMSKQIVELKTIVDKLENDLLQTEIDKQAVWG